MTARTQEQILADLLANTGRAAQLRRKLAANQSRNWLLALVLHSFGRFAEHAQLSDLEAGIIKAFKQNGYDDTELTRQGKMALKLPSDVRAELFPPDFAALASGSAFTLDQLRAAAPGIVKTMLAQPNVAVVDVEGIHAGRTTLRDVRMPSEEVLRKYASAATVAIEPNAPAAVSASGGSGSGLHLQDQGDQVSMQPPGNQLGVRPEERVLRHLRFARGGRHDHHAKPSLRERRHRRYPELLRHRWQHLGAQRSSSTPAGRRSRRDGVGVGARLGRHYPGPRRRRGGVRGGFR